MKKNYGCKLKAIRTAEGLTVASLARATGIAETSIKSYESGTETGLSIIEKTLRLERFQKYTLWLMIGKTSESAGQIEPALSHSGRAKTESAQLTNRAG